MRIKNIDGLSARDLQREASAGARFVYFPFTVSLVIVTFKRTSGVYLIRPADHKLTKAFPFILLSFLFGWWGIPFGPKLTLQSIRSSLGGGKDVTEEVMSTVAGHILFRESQAAKADLHKK
jgi:hypothetical protein